MQSIIRVALLASIVVTSSVAAAQAAFLGKWKGEAVDSDGLVYLLSFEMPEADSTVIMGSLKSPGVDMMEVPLNDFKQTGTGFSFALHIDERFDCSVEPIAGSTSYTGICQNQEGQGAKLVLQRIEQNDK